MRKPTVHLAAMLLLASGFTLVGAAPKANCANETFATTGATTQRVPCYSDLSVLYRSEQLASGRMPYLDACEPPDHLCDEYPVLTMFTMWAAARTGGVWAGFAGFFWANVLVVLACVLVAVWALERMGARTVLFAAAPALLLYASLNWDMLAVAAATVATLLVVQRRSVGSGVWLGVGAAAKVYPVLLALPFAWQRARDDGRGEGIRLAVATAAAWFAINVGFIATTPEAWAEVFRFNGQRGADFESLWTALCRLHVCVTTPWLNVLILLIAIAAITWIWRGVGRRHPETPPWMMGFPILVVVVVTAKFWSPQYALWLLPWFALSRIPTRTWFTYQAAEVVEYFARSSFMSGPSPGISLNLLSLVVTIRALLLLWCLWSWTRNPLPAIGLGRRSLARPTMAPTAT